MPDLIAAYLVHLTVMTAALSDPPNPLSGGPDTPGTADWMRELATHYEAMRRRYPDDELCVVFDIDGTILDPRYVVVEVLLQYDRAHGTEYFYGLRVEDIDAHENRVGPVVGSIVPPEVLPGVMAWLNERRRTPETIAAALRPYAGVLGMIRWFTILPRTSVALNTGRPEYLRRPTLASLNAVGRRYRVAFKPELLCMNPRDWEDGVAEAKVAGLRRLRSLGLRIVAVVENEPAEIEAMAADDDTGEILFLHADTVFQSLPSRRSGVVTGSTYDLGNLVSEDELASRVQFVWHGVNDAANLQEFLDSDVRWAEVDVRRDPLDRVVLRHDSFTRTPWHRSERPFLLTECVDAVRSAGRSVKLDFKDNSDAVKRAMALVERLGFEDSSLWFNSAVECIGEQGFRDLRMRYPGATISSPVDFLAPLVLAAPHVAGSVLSTLRNWGINRLSLSWGIERFHDVFDRFCELGWDVNVYRVPDLAAFLEAALLMPRSLTADFNFPAWGYHGHGSGERHIV